MARTKQTARSSGASRRVVDDEDEFVCGNAPDIEGDEDEEYSDQEGTQASTGQGKSADDEGHVSAEEKRKREEIEQAPMRAELLHLEKKWTKKGKAYFSEPQEDEEIPEQKTNWYEKSALVLTREYDQSNKYVSRQTLSVNSPALKEALRAVIGSFPGISFFTDKIILDLPPRCLYHYRPELQEYTDEKTLQEPESETASHMPVLMHFIAEHFSDTIKESDNLRTEGLINFDLLWTIFRPGCLVYSTLLGESRAFKLSNYSYGASQCGRFLSLNVTYVDFDGDAFGTRNTQLQVWETGGAIPIDALTAFPLSFHPDEKGARRALVERGRKWEAHAGQHFVEYKGIALDTKGSRYNLDCRTMIDCFTHHRVNSNNSFTVVSFPKPYGVGGSNNTKKRKPGTGVNDAELVPQDERKFDPLTDDQALLASPMVRGFSFSEKKFLDFFIDKVRPIEWNTKCFEQLVLPDSQKELVQALVSEHTQRSSSPNKAAFDDIVKGKGLGLILVLHGPPGVGKTLTAECVAEFAERPLYIVSSGDLGTSASVLDERLSRTLDLASTWKAVLLIDEADVFLERRSLHDMERNSLVSIFLRTLEYYSGILFMTTNRIKTFDDAFKSRIHVPLRYGELPAPSRALIWRNFLGGVEGDVEVDDDACRRLAEGRLNGRQIKNVVRTARSLAAYKRRKLDYTQLQQVMEIQMAFERDLDEDARTAVPVRDEDIDMVAC